MRKFLTILYALLAAACAGYYFLIGYTARFGLSMSTVWLGLAAVFAIAAALNAWRKTPKWVNIAIRELFAVGLGGADRAGRACFYRNARATGRRILNT